MIELRDDRERIAFLYRRAGWGLRPGELDGLVAGGVDAAIDHLIDPDGAGIAPEASAWEDVVLTDRPQGEDRRDQTLATFSAWMDRLLHTDRPLDHRLAWFWHDHFAVSYQAVQHLPSLVGHLELLRTAGRGDFVELIRAVSVDAAMLVFLDGAGSTGDAPNENYGRELLELYTVGVEHYTEDDVRAAATALTGWVVARRAGWSVRFVPSRHDDTPQTLLGVDGVHDVGTVVEAACAHPACPTFIARKLARAWLGAVDDETVLELAGTFAAADLDVTALADAVLRAGVSGRAEPIVVEPVVWLVQTLRATGADPDSRLQFGLLHALGQVPGNPPNVGGFPGASTWLAASATAARFSAANVVARETPDDSPALAAAAERDWGELADLLLRPGGFAPTTVASLDGLSADAGRRPGEAQLALALSAPDLVVA